VQEATGRLLLRLVPAPGCDRESISTRVLARFREQLPDGVEVRVGFVSELPHSLGGKIRAVKCL
jgi:hypothetical protein